MAGIVIVGFIIFCTIVGCILWGLNKLLSITLIVWNGKEHENEQERTDQSKTEG